MSKEFDHLASIWRQNTADSFNHLAVMDHLRQMGEMSYSKKRCDAMADATFRGCMEEYEAPVRDGDDMLLYNNLIIHPDALDALNKSEEPDKPTEPVTTTEQPQVRQQPQPRTRPQPNGIGRIMPALLVGSSLLLSGVAIAWALYNRPPSQQPSPPVYVWDLQPTDSATTADP